MSLYYETAPYVTAGQEGGSLKSRVFGAGPTKSPAIQIFALASEASKWSSVLAEVIDNAQLLQNVRKLTPNIALLLVHDLLLTKRGISAPTNHPLRLAVEKHKARLAAELTRSRLRRGLASLEQLRAYVKERGTQGEVKEQEATNRTSLDNVPIPKVWAQPRWVRVNTLQTSLEVQLTTTFADYKVVESLEEVTTTVSPYVQSKLLHIDKHIPNLLALPPATDLSRTSAYLDGLIILQDKASCFPAYLLDPVTGDSCLDACAAPGNKTTHLAAITYEKSLCAATAGPTIYASERDLKRAATLDLMVAKAGATDRVRMHRQDFLKFDPTRPPCNHVDAVLLDPSCSGSGIVSRDEVFNVVLPRQDLDPTSSGSSKRKRKRAKLEPAVEVPAADLPEEEQEAPLSQDDTAEKLRARLEALSDFQLRLLLHAFQFPKAYKITYSTCSIYAEENEDVVIRALLQSCTQGLGWRILLRNEQIEGMRAWDVRGDPAACQKHLSDRGLDPQEIAEACIRCEKGTKEGTQGFFVAAFVRELDANTSHANEDEHEWEGFDDT